MGPSIRVSILITSSSHFFIISNSSFSQEKKEKENNNSVYTGLKFRSIGPALMSGRISDIAIHPDNESVWYVTVGSGNVWKTVNAGVTWTPIFDDQPSYSIGCVTLDPSNPNTVWIGTGENLGGRHFGYGDGVYKSEDGGKSWKNTLEINEWTGVTELVIDPNLSLIHISEPTRPY